MRGPNKFLVANGELMALLDREDELWFERRDLEKKERLLAREISKKVDEIQKIDWEEKI